MRRTLGQSLALAVLGGACLTGCGSGTGSASDHADAPASGSAAASASASASDTARSQPDVTRVALVSQTAAGGRVGERPVRLDTPAAVHRFTAPFRGGTLAGKVAAAVRRADVPPGRVLLGAVVAVGCDIPPGVRVVGSGPGLRLVATPVRQPKQECFAPVTTVAVVSVPAGAV